MAGEAWHRDRRRAESFGAGVAEYDRHRPPHADGLFDELAALRPDRVLDVGCGSGRAAAGLVARGLDVLGVEPDERMAAVARSRGVRVEIGTFEDWDAAGRTFDLVVCGSAWHWIEPERGIAQAAAVLRPGGTLARFWSFHVLADEALARLAPVYACVAPQLRPHGVRPPTAWTDPVVTASAFGRVTTTEWHEPVTFSATGWTDLLGTFSDVATMDADLRAELFAGLRAVVDDHLGGTLRATSRTHALRCVRAGVR